MKKIVSLIIIIALLLVNTVVFAAENQSFDISLKSDKEQVNPGDEITVVLSIKNIKNITEGLWAYQAFIQWDSNVIETSENDVTKCGEWNTPLFYPSSLMDSNITSEVSGSESVKKDGDVFTIKFKVKDNAITGKNTTIIVKDFYASDGENDIEASKEAKIQIAIVEKNTTENEGTEGENQGSQEGNEGSQGENQGSQEGNEGNQGENQGSQGENQGNQEGNEGNQGENQGSQGENQGNQTGGKENNSGNSNSSNSSIPQTGENDILIVFMILGAIILGIMSYIGYRKYNNI